MLYNDCCGRDNSKFEKTVSLLKSGIISKEEIHKNLNLVRAIPFLDEKIDNNLKYKKITPTHEKWNDYCNAQRENYLDRLKAYCK